MKIKHFQGYGYVKAKKIKSNGCTLHVKVSGDHEWGIINEDEYDLFNWLVKRFDKSISSPFEFHKLHPKIEIIPGYDLKEKTEICHYLFTYDKAA